MEQITISPQFNPTNSLQLLDFPSIYQSKFPQYYYYYIDGSFIPSKQFTNEIGDLVRVGQGIWNLLLKINILHRLIGLENILRVRTSAIHHTL